MPAGACGLATTCSFRVRRGRTESRRADPTYGDPFESSLSRAVHRWGRSLGETGLRIWLRASRRVRHGFDNASSSSTGSGPPACYSGFRSHAAASGEGLTARGCDRAQRQDLEEHRCAHQGTAIGFTCRVAPDKAPQPACRYGWQIGVPDRCPCGGSALQLPCPALST